MAEARRTTQVGAHDASRHPHPHRLNPANLLRAECRDTRYSSTSPVSGGIVDGDQPRRACPARSCRNRRRSRARARPAASRSSSSDAAGTDGASARIVASSANTFRSGALARLSVPIGDAHAGRRRSPRSAARPAPVWPLLRGQVTSVVPRAPSRCRSAGVICTPCTASTRASRKPLSSRNCTGVRPGGTHAGSQTPRLLEQRAPRAAAAADELDLLGRFGQVDAARRERVAIDRLRESRGTRAARPNTARAPPGWRAHAFGRHERVRCCRAAARRSSARRRR